MQTALLYLYMHTMMRGWQAWHGMLAEKSCGDLMGKGLKWYLNRTVLRGWTGWIGMARESTEGKRTKRMCIAHALRQGRKQAWTRWMELCLPGRREDSLRGLKHWRCLGQSRGWKAWVDSHRIHNLLAQGASKWRCEATTRAFGVWAGNAVPHQQSNAKRSFASWVHSSLARGWKMLGEHRGARNLQRRASTSGKLHAVKVAWGRFLEDHKASTMFRSALTSAVHREIRNAFSMLLHHVSERVRGRVLLVYGKRHHLQQTLWRGWTPWQLAYNQKVAHTENEQAFAAMERDYERHVKPILHSVGMALGLGTCMTLFAALLYGFSKPNTLPPPLPPSLPPVSPPVLILRDDDTMIVQSQSSLFVFVLMAFVLLFCICLACIAHAQRASRSQLLPISQPLTATVGPYLHSLASQAPYMQLAEEDEHSPLNTQSSPAPPPVTIATSPHVPISTAHVHMAMDETPRASPDLPQHLVEQDQLQERQLAMQQMQVQMQIQQNELMNAAAMASPTKQEELQDKQIEVQQSQIELQRQQNELLKLQLQQAPPSPPSRPGRFEPVSQHVHITIDRQPFNKGLHSTRKSAHAHTPQQFSPRRAAPSTDRDALQPSKGFGSGVGFGMSTPRFSGVGTKPPVESIQITTLEKFSPRRSSPATPRAQVYIPSSVDASKGFGSGVGFGMSTPRFSGGSSKPPADSARKPSPTGRKSSLRTPVVQVSPVAHGEAFPSPPRSASTGAKPSRSPPRARPGQETMKSRYRSLKTHPERKWGEQRESRRITVAPQPHGDKSLWVDGWNYGSPFGDPDPTKISKRPGSTTPSPRQSPRGASPRAQPLSEP